jgi:very-short-patch-repair endonuclease
MRGPDRKTARKVRRLRKIATDAETKLWLAVRDRRLGGFKFVRQEAIGPYVADLVCRERKLVVEVDGGQHAENVRDRARDAFLISEGIASCVSGTMTCCRTLTACWRRFCYP